MSGMDCHDAYEVVTNFLHEVIQHNDASTLIFVFSNQFCKFLHIWHLIHKLGNDALIFHFLVNILPDRIAKHYIFNVLSARNH